MPCTSKRKRAYIKNLTSWARKKRRTGKNVEAEKENLGDEMVRHVNNATFEATYHF